MGYVVKLRDLAVITGDGELPMLDLIPNSIIKPLILILWIVNVIDLRRHLLKAKLVSIHLQEHVLCAMVAAN